MEHGLFPAPSPRPMAVVLPPAPAAPAADTASLTAQVVFSRSASRAFSYLVPARLAPSIAPGKRVVVPFGRQNHSMVGFCVAVTAATVDRVERKELRSVLDDQPLLSPSLLLLAEWIADRYFCGLGQVLETMVPRGVKRHAGTRAVTMFRLPQRQAGSGSPGEGSTLPAKQRQVLEALSGAFRPLRLAELEEAAGCGPGPIKSLVDKGLVEAISERIDDFSAAPVKSPAIGGHDLNTEQAAAFSAIARAVEMEEHRSFLLYGVTGSGKTEVYIRAIAEVVRRGRQAIVLVPEISLTPQTIRRFRARFGKVAVLHSRLSDSERNWQWQRIARGEVDVIIGARSAVFAPTPRLGLLVIDEEHEPSFKQDTAPRYHAREVARRRAELEGVPLVLGSATPALESWHRAEQKKDVLLELPHRVENRSLPPVVVVDIRHDPQRSRGSIGRALESAMRRSLEAGGQVILFLNLRGYAPTLWCPKCGYAAHCADCDVTLTYHRDRDAALCHTCGRETTITRCQQCGHTRISQLGVGTQRLEREVRARFADYSCLRMDSDSMRRYGSHDAALEAFRRGEVRILLGTQMIAKGLDFPNVTLVGVVSGDTALYQGDFRARERTFQLIAQVAGRTGRGPLGGRVYVQTMRPEEAAIQRSAQHDYRGFVAEELARRRQLRLPPIDTMARVIVRGRDEDAVKRQTERMVGAFEAAKDALGELVRLVGPAPAPVAKIEGRWRYHFQLMAPRFESLRRWWSAVEGHIPRTKGVEFVVDVDPLNLR